MKKFAVSLFFILILFSCDYDLINKQKIGLPQSNSDFGRVYIQKAKNRSAMPGFDEENVAGYDFYITNAEGKYEEFMGRSFDLTDWGDHADGPMKQKYVEVPAGTWNFILRGFDSDFNHICEGRMNNVTISKNYVEILAFRLSPINSGRGNIYIKVNFPEDAGIVEVVTTIDGKLVEPPLLVHDDYFVYDTLEDLDSGDYLFVFKLLDKDEKIAAVITEIVVVRKNLESRKIIELDENDINMVPKTPLEFAAKIVSVSGTAGIRFDWLGVSGTETGFVINNGIDEYEIDGGFNTYTLPSLPAEANFRIKAVNDFGESPWSESIEARLAAPDSVTVDTVTTTSISLLWDVVYYASGYRIYRSTSSTGVYNMIGNSTGSSYTDSGLTTGATYYYKIAAYTADKVGLQAAYVSWTTLPEVPTGVTTVATSITSITVSWDSVVGATGYRIYRSLTSDGIYTQIGTSNTASFINTALSSDTAYHYKVSAYNAGGEGAQSVYVSKTIFTSTITYNVNGATGITPVTQTVLTDSSVTLPDNSAFLRIGYTFCGWNTSISGTGTNYNASASYTVVSNVTLYARWDTGSSGTQASPFLLAPNIWNDGAITSYTVPVWYAFNVTGGTTYYIWWNYYNYGNNTKTLRYALVSAYHSNGAVILLNEAVGAYASPRSFTATADGIVRIVVSSNPTYRYTGTFAITYRTTDVRPN